MFDQKLQEYVANQLKQGVDPEVLRMALESEGLSSSEVDLLMDDARMSTENLVEALTKPVKKDEAAILSEATSGKIKESLRVSFTADPIGYVKSLFTGKKQDLSKPFSLKSFWVKKKWWVLGFVGAIILAVGGFNGYQYLNVTPEEAVLKTLSSVTQARSFDFDGSIKLTGKSGIYADPLDPIKKAGSIPCLPEGICKPPRTQEVIIGDIYFTGTFDAYDSGSPKILLSATFRSYTTGKDSISDLKLDIFYMDEYLFIKFNKDFSNDDKSLNQFSDKWIKVKAQNLLREVSAGTEDAADQKNQASFIKNLLKNKDRVVTALTSRNVFSINERMDDEMIDNKDTRHYSFGLSKTELNQFFFEAYKIGISEREDSQKLQTSVVLLLDKFIKNLDFSGGEVWVGKGDYLPRLVKYSVKVGDTASQNEFSGQFDAQVNLKNFNSVRSVEAPYPYTDLNDLNR
jgi:hypothetical protein